ncbi:SIR2 family protein [Paraoerskovia marina]|uniref:SIR2 family protein n=1 Tax=Paraoerskovia marina TaxID=545619 RepID=UPI001E5D3363|nr:SIR2 family protein [Paraoerskovia marina]
MEQGNAVIFVGAGLSQGAGLPGWEELLETPSRESEIPSESDLPLKAEYIITEGTYHRERLEQHILAEIATTSPRPTSTHSSLSLLPVNQFWTTNYDTLLEESIPDATVVEVDSRIQVLGSVNRSIVKMHGSIGTDDGRHKWESPPVITRSDYENYERDWPRTASLLRATYLSKTFLFLGFSFTDANIEILLSLSRRLSSDAGTRHLTVIRRPSAKDSDARRLHNLKVRDLELSGVRVLEIDDHAEIEPLLERLIRRTRPTRLFIAGSGETTDTKFRGYCSALGVALANKIDWEICSLGGPSGWCVSREVARIRRAENTYSPEQIVTRFRGSTAPPPPMDERVGTAVFSDLTREPLVKGTLAESRAMVVIEGATRTKEEIIWAAEAGLGVVPIAGSGGAAQEYWQENRDNPPELGGQTVDIAVWERLGSDDPHVAARAAVALLSQAMYETQ